MTSRRPPADTPPRAEAMQDALEALESLSPSESAQVIAFASGEVADESPQRLGEVQDAY